MPDRLTITTDTGDGGQVVVAVAGEVDLATAPQLAECLLGITDRDVAVDLSAVTFLDSSGISALVAANKALTANGHSLRTFGEQDNVRRVFEITGLDKVFHGDTPSE